MSHLLRLRPRRAYVAKNDHCSSDFLVTVVDGGNGVFDEYFVTVAVDEYTIRRQIPGHVFRCGLRHGIEDWLLSGCVHDPEDFGQVATGGLL